MPLYPKAKPIFVLGARDRIETWVDLEIFSRLAIVTGRSREPLKRIKTFYVSMPILKSVTLAKKIITEGKRNDTPLPFICLFRSSLIRLKVSVYQLFCVENDDSFLY